jgi:hypothetical protein
MSSAVAKYAIENLPQALKQKPGEIPPKIRDKMLKRI